MNGAALPTRGEDARWDALIHHCEDRWQTMSELLTSSISSFMSELQHEREARAREAEEAERLKREWLEALTRADQTNQRLFEVLDRLAGRILTSRTRIWVAIIGVLAGGTLLGQPLMHWLGSLISR